jgi:N,N'-diacetyllegionaminate synthase
MLDLSTRDRCFVIAEAGTAHLGSVMGAIDLVHAAKDAGADAVKFQWFTPGVNQDTMFCWIEGDEERAEWWRKSALDSDDWARVKEYADSIGIMLLASAFENETVAWLGFLDIEATKVASRAAADFPYDEASKPWLVSTGMYSPLEIPTGAFLIQCEARYPSQIKWWKTEWGFSDHSGKPFLGIDAISRGCKLLEVHFMIDLIDAGPDLPACLTLDELKLVCRARDYFNAERVAA